MFQTTNQSSYGVPLWLRKPPVPGLTHPQRLVLWMARLRFKVVAAINGDQTKKPHAKLCSWQKKHLEAKLWSVFLCIKDFHPYISIPDFRDESISFGQPSNGVQLPKRCWVQCLFIFELGRPSDLAAPEHRAYQSHPWITRFFSNEHVRLSLVP